MRKDDVPQLRDDLPKITQLACPRLSMHRVCVPFFTVQTAGISDASLELAASFIGGRAIDHGAGGARVDRRAGAAAPACAFAGNCDFF